MVVLRDRIEPDLAVAEVAVVRQQQGGLGPDRGGGQHDRGRIGRHRHRDPGAERELAGPSSYTPIQTRCGRPPAWLTHPTRPGGSGRLTVRVSTPELRSHGPAHSPTSVPAARLRQSSRSARVAQPNLYRAK